MSDGAGRAPSPVNSSRLDFGPACGFRTSCAFPQKGHHNPDVEEVNLKVHGPTLNLFALAGAALLRYKIPALSHLEPPQLPTSNHLFLNNHHPTFSNHNHKSSTSTSLIIKMKLLLFTTAALQLSAGAFASSFFIFAVWNPVFACPPPTKIITADYCLAHRASSTMTRPSHSFPRSPANASTETKRRITTSHATSQKTTSATAERASCARGLAVPGRRETPT